MQQQRFSHLTFLTPKDTESQGTQNKHGLKVNVFTVGQIKGSLASAHTGLNQWLQSTQFYSSLNVLIQALAWPRGELVQEVKLAKN